MKAADEAANLKIPVGEKGSKSRGAALNPKASLKSSFSEQT